MPRVTKLYESSRRGLKHNLGGFFGKPKKKQMPGPELEGKTVDELVLKAEPKPKPKPKKRDEWTEKTKAGISRRRKALEELTKD